jgi:hypothetical protein
MQASSSMNAFVSTITARLQASLYYGILPLGRVDFRNGKYCDIDGSTQKGVIAFKEIAVKMSEVVKGR